MVNQFQIDTLLFPSRRKKQVREDQSRRNYAADSGGNKFRNLGKSVGSKVEGFRATKNLIKSLMGKGLFLKLKILLKFP